MFVGSNRYPFSSISQGTGRLDDFWSFDFESRIWEQVEVISSEKPGCRENNGVVISDSSDSIYLFGGMSQQGLLSSVP
jgi:leucine-zipper-like transcriptional regulator 1